MIISSRNFENIKTGARLLNIITIMIIIIISTINAILEEKKKATGGFTNKTVWTCLYPCYLDNNSFMLFVFCFWSFSCKNIIFFRIYNLVLVNLMKIKIKIYFLKKEIHSRLETQFFVKCRFKMYIKSSLWETKKCPTRFDILTTNVLCKKIEVFLVTIYI